MNAYIEPIRFAFLFFPIIAFLFTLPYIFHQYHKYGSILFLRVVIIYSLILYLTTIYFLVILPLPSIEVVQNLKTDWVQLVPFQFVKEFILQSSFLWDDPSTYIEVIKEPYFYQVFYNILLTVPFGIYLRYYFKCSFLKTLCFSFLLTLFFEGTQLSGLYGIYPRPYRLFDIDDLFLNTLGGIIGYGITPIFSRWLPTRQKLDQLSYHKGKYISNLRRMIAAFFDLFTVAFLTLLLDLLGLNQLLLQYIFSVILIFMIIPTIRGGFTFGKKWMNIRIVTLTEEQPKWYQYWIRYGILYLFLIPMPMYLLWFFKKISFVILILFGILSLIFLFHALISLFKKQLFWYEKLSATKNQSTIKMEVEE